MKIGIITRHDVYNYGAILQAYALETYITSFGHDVEIIDYQSKERRDIRKIILLPKLPQKINSHNIKCFISECKMMGGSILYFYERRQRKKYFEDFSKKYIHKSKKTYMSEEELLSEKISYDAYISGSDQVWKVNPTFEHLEKPFFLCFAEKDKPHIAYAVSLGRERYPKKYESEISKLLTNLDFISLREKGSIDYIQSLTDIPIILVLDPVFLLTKSQWKAIATIPAMKRDYILVYSVSYDKFMCDIIEIFSRETRWDIVYIGHDYAQKTYRPIYRKPEEFVGLFSGAAYVITNSFHGTAFSIIFEKNFTSVLPRDEGFRISELLNSLSLTSRITKDVTEVHLIHKHISERINYAETNKKLNKLLHDSKNFIQNSLNR